MTVEGTLKKLQPSGSASLELERVEHLITTNISRQIINEFGDVSRSINGIQFTLRNVTLALGVM